VKCASVLVFCHTKLSGIILCVGNSKIYCKYFIVSHIMFFACHTSRSYSYNPQKFVRCKFKIFS